MASGLSILYVGPGLTKDLSPGDPGVIFACTDTPITAAKVKQRPDIVLMAPFDEGDDGENISLDLVGAWLDDFATHTFKFAPAVFVAVPVNTGKNIRMSLMAAGADQVVDQPLNWEEIHLKARVFQEKLHLEQALFNKTGSLEKSFGYLDRFKGELKEVKEELFEDKRNLNTALKQIQQMTEERKRLKLTLSRTKKQLLQNMDGFGRFLYTLIRHRVEKNRGHGERVAAIACFIAEQMGLSQKKLEDLSKAGMLHETGLLFLSEDHLSKRILGKKDNNDSSSGTPGAYDQVPDASIPC